MPPLLWLVPVSADTPSGVFEAAFTMTGVGKFKCFGPASKTPLAALVWDEFPVLLVGVCRITYKAVPSLESCGALPVDVFAKGLHGAEAMWTPGTFFKQRRISQRTKASALCNFH